MTGTTAAQAANTGPTAAGRGILIGGGTSAAGHAVARSLLDAGARVISVGSDRERLDALAAALPGILTECCDLTDEAAVEALSMRARERLGRVDGLVSLVGGWRGGGGIAGQTEADYRVLERSLTALRLTSRALWTDLAASDAGRVAIVSSTAVANPTAGVANYAAVKAASESWMRSLGRAFADVRGRDASRRGAAVVFRVGSLAGLEERLAREIVALWSLDVEGFDGAPIELAPSSA